MAFTVGMKVVCVDASRGKFNGLDVLEFGAIYTIEGFDPETELLGVYLVGIPNSFDPRWAAPLSWRAERFRPLVDAKKSVSFTTGADPQSDQWDNRRPVEVHTFDEAAHQEILRFLAGF